MNIPASVHQAFGVKIFSCESWRLRYEQKKRKTELIEKLSRSKNELLSGDPNQIHPQWLKNKQDETQAFNFLKKICDSAGITNEQGVKSEYELKISKLNDKLLSERSR